MNDAQLLALLMAVLRTSNPTLAVQELAAGASEILNEAQHESRCRARHQMNT